MPVGSGSPLVVVALGGNALLLRGEDPAAGGEQRAARAAAAALAPAVRDVRAVVTHGDGPQVGLLALAHAGASLDELGALAEGRLGYLVELELANAAAGREVVALLTRTEVDGSDPAFAAPVKPIGPVYDEDTARRVAAEHGWDVAPDGSGWRRVVASPRPRAILELQAVRALADAGFLVVCAGGGGIPVLREPGGRWTGVEAVVDKDLASALLARELGADALILATDVDAVYAGFGTPQARALADATPAELRALELAPGSMGPKVGAALDFVEHGGRRAAIGALADLAGLLAGSAGTQVRPAPGR